MNKHRFDFDEHILYNDGKLLVINKPAYMPSIDERNFTTPSLLSVLRKKFPQIQLCHRLDKETSGIILACLDHDLYKKINKLFEDRKVSKLYHAVVGGVKNFNETVIDLPIRETKKAFVVIDRAGKNASTLFNSLQYFKHYTLVECKPVTGRMHQIRIHLASQNASIVGDQLYGGKFPKMSEFKRGYKTGKDGIENTIFDRVALHARSIKFEIDGESFSFEAPYPKDLSVFIKLLNKYDL